MLRVQTDRSIFVLNGPNLNLLGQREPELYGRHTLEDVVKLCTHKAAEFGRTVDARQSNHEGILIDWIHEARQDASGLVLNPAGLTHTSVALRDAIVTVNFPVYEVHITNVHRREEFREHSYISGVVDGVIAGFGIFGYAAAVEKICQSEEP
jgi:3-dehydroquinate dehydratase II